MAVRDSAKVVRALLEAQARNAWNRTRRESALGGPVATLAVLLLVAAVLALPGLLTLGLGLDLGEELRASPDPALLQRWNAFQALFTVVFAVLGSFRHRPAFQFRDIGRFPVTPLQLLAAELPASLFEVFPLLGAAGIACSNLGLAVRLSAAAPLVAILAVEGIASMVAVLFLAATLRRFLLRRRARALAFGLGVLAAAMALGREGFRTLFRSWIPQLIPILPGSQGYAGLLDLGQGNPATGLARILAALAATAALLTLAAWLHRRQLGGESSPTGPRQRACFDLRFERPASGVGRLFFRQLLDSKAGRVLLFGPLMFSAPAILLAWAIQYDASRDRLFRDATERLSAALGGVPIFEIFLVLVIVLDSQIWMNQFGWDREGVRTLLLLPVAPRDLLVGKTLGLLRFTALQALIGVPPLFSLTTPSLRDAISAVAAAGSVFLVVAGTGQVFSSRFPRAAAWDGGAALPLYVSWVPTVLLLIMAGALTGVHAIAGLAGEWATAGALVALFGAVAALHAAALPTLESRLRLEQERLLRM